MGGHFFLSERFDPTSHTKNNEAVFMVAAILKHVMASAAEAELGGPVHQRQGIRGTQKSFGRNGTPTSSNAYANG